MAQRPKATRTSPRVLLLASVGFLVGAYALVLANRQPEADTVPAVRATPTPAESPDPVSAGPNRSLPEACNGLISGEAIWNDAYQAGFEATRRGDHEAAKLAMCQALAAVSNSPADDWRFAETLDELGLVFYRLRDYDTCVAVQGRAVAEILLAQGPDSPDVGKYVERLLFADEAWSSSDPGHMVIGLRKLKRDPYRIFGELDLIDWTPSARGRLQWLRAEYLKRENLLAASFLARAL